MGKNKRRLRPPATREDKRTNDIALHETAALMPWLATVFLGLIMTLVGSTENPTIVSFPLRLALCVGLDSSLGRAFSSLLLPWARRLARHLPGSVVPATDDGCAAEEKEQHDPQMTWPPSAAVATLPTGWTASSSSEKQPYYLNHVRGSNRFRQATQRIGLAMGTVLTVAAMARWVDREPLRDVGLELRVPDLIRGLIVGGGIVAVLFAAEVGLGWIRVIGYLEVVVPGESLPINLLWDVIFHLAVSINEELTMRGWILVHTARWAVSDGMSPSTAMALSVFLQSSLFAFLHLGSPGASRFGLLNLAVGGAAAAVNVFLSGGLSFGLGWHFGWNICMGHLLGMSTSGIPMSAKLVSVVPRPGGAHLHGGRFGPEAGVLAPATYLLGCAALIAMYGTEGLDVWRERLGTATAP